MLWQIVVVIAGISCFVYYAALCAVIRSFNAPFIRFWLGAGAVCFLLAFLPQRGGTLWTVCRIVLAVCFLCLMIVEGLILRGMNSDSVPGLTYIIVLGAQVRGRRVTGCLRRRLERALTYLRENPQTRVIVSGGQGEGEEITEARAMACYLEDRGIDPERIIEEGQSRTTEENLRFSARYASGGREPVGLVTNNFHMYRACRYAVRLGYKEVHPIPAGCQRLLLVNYMVREFFALIKYWIRCNLLLFL